MKKFLVRKLLCGRIHNGLNQPLMPSMSSIALYDTYSTDNSALRTYSTSLIVSHQNHSHDSTLNQINISLKTSRKIEEVSDVDEEDLEEMFVMGPAGMEWGGPTRGGRRPEPTRYGDWERKGRVTDF